MTEELIAQRCRHAASCGGGCCWAIGLSWERVDSSCVGPATQALDRGAAFSRADVMVTGHNADDVAETVLLNILRGDVPRLSRCASIMTGRGGPLPRAKPFKYTYEKEIVMYAYFK